MNAKKMNVSSGATATGIVSLYNKGFVPKNTGKINNKSKFGTFNKNLYPDSTAGSQKQDIQIVKK